MQFTVLASGSSGNASLIEADGTSILVDAGLGPRQLDARLRAVAATWSDIRAVFITHAHSDHCNERTLQLLARARIPFFCHPKHRSSLRKSRGFAALDAARLAREYEPGSPVKLAPRLRCHPFQLRHDDFTCGFRLDGPADLFGQQSSMAYLTDLGCWQPQLVEQLVDVEVLALEFNHDVRMERTSGRPPFLVRRVLGSRGHLSNEQAAALLREIVKQSHPGRLQHVVQLHLSNECNRPALAAAAARRAMLGLHKVHVHTASAQTPGPRLRFGSYQMAAKFPAKRRARLTVSTKKFACAWHQPCFPGWDAPAAFH